MKTRRIQYYVPYMFLFLLIFGFLSGILLRDGKALIRRGDAITEHYPAFLTIGRFYRDTIKAVFTGQSLPSTWDFSFGYGTDLVQSLSFYGLADWSTVLFAVFSSKLDGVFLYTIMMLFRTFLSGLCFVFFCRQMKCSRIWGTVASIAYLLCPYMLENVFNGHHFFSLPMLYLPLILVCMEKRLHGEKTRLLPLVIALAALSSYYFFYMEMICAVVFFIARYFNIFDKDERSFGHFVGLALSSSLLVIIGILMAAPILFPQVSALMVDSRMGGEKVTELLYSTKEYKQAIGNLISSDSFSYYSQIGISSCIWIGFLILVVRRKEKWLQSMLLFFLLTLLIPMAGKIMNGFGYVANRHVWIWSFLLCFAFAIGMGSYKELTVKTRIVMVGIVTAYAGILAMMGSMRDREIRMEIILLFAGVVLVSLWPNNLKELYVMVAICLMVFLGAFIHLRTIFVDKKGYSSFMLRDEIPAYYIADHNGALSYTESDPDVFRLDWEYGQRKPNSIDMKWKTGSTYQYCSFLNGYLTDYLIRNGTIVMPYEIIGLDNRYYLRSLLGCKYVVDKSFDGRPGYKKTDRDDIFKNELALPIIRLYSRSISEKAYLNSTFGERQVEESMACILSEAEDIQDISTLLNGKVVKLAYDISTGKNIFTDGTLEIKDIRRPVSFAVDCPGDGELYLEIYNLRYINDEKKETNSAVRAVCKNVVKSYPMYSPYDKLFFGNRDYLFNFDYSEKERNKIDLFFGYTGIYTFDKIVIEYVPYSGFVENLSAFDRDALRGISLAGGTLRTEAELQKEQILYCAIPYSEGWKAWIDGEEQQVFNANLMGLGIRVPAGYHEIVFRYTTPLLKAGLVAMTAGVLAYIVVLLVDKRKRKVQS